MGILDGEEKIFENFIFEMATIGPQAHKLGVNLKMHILQPGRKQPPHGPRVKFFTKGMETSGFSISLNEDPQKIRLVAGDYMAFLTESQFNALLEKVRKYRIPFLNMWNDPEMTQDELIEQMQDVDAGRKVI